MNLLTLSRKNIFRNRRRSLLSGSAITIATATMFFLFAFVAGLKEDMASQIQDYMTGEIRIQHKDFDKNEMVSPLALRVDRVSELLTALDQRSEVAAAVPRITFPGVYFQGEEKKPLLGWALDFPREDKFTGLSRQLVEGRLPSPGKKETVIGTYLARDLGLKVGDEISVLFRTARMSSNYMNFTITGLVAFPLGALNSQIFLVDRGVMAPKLFLDDGATKVLVKTLPGTDVKALADQLAFSLADPLEVKTWEEIPSLYSYIGLAEFIYDFIALFFYLLASTVILSTTMMVIFERVREIGTIAALGMTEREILTLFFLEAFQIALAGTLLGVIIGLGITLPLSQTGIDLRGMMDKLDLGVTGMIYPLLNFRSLVVVPLGAVLVASLASFLPSRRATQISPVEALRTYS